MKDKAYAKINILLNVKSRREDGYHDLSMVMVPINFYDLIDIEISDTMSMKQSVGYIPINDKNTVIKAINVLRNRYNFKENFKINLVKHIPTQAGLAGGSADAAATIRILNKLLKLNMNLTEMIEVGKEVGADVPFCIANRPALVEGIGEKLEYFDVNTDFDILLVKPKKGVSTKLAFTNLDLEKCEHPDARLMVDDLKNNRFDNVIKKLKNSLEYSSFSLVKEIKDIKDELLELGFDGALMSGSGSCVFGLTRNKVLLSYANDYFKSKKLFTRITKIK